PARPKGLRIRTAHDDAAEALELLASSGVDQRVVAEWDVLESGALHATSLTKLRGRGLARRSVAVDHASESEGAVADGALFLPPPGRRTDDATREARERERLEPDLPGSRQRREEDPFAAEDRRLDLADVLDVVADGRHEGHDAAGVDAHLLAGSELELVDGA